jgi:hypothetical protein
MKPHICLCDDERLSNPEKYFDISVFYGFLDVDALGHRFKGLGRVTGNFQHYLPHESTCRNRRGFLQWSHNFD